MVKKYVFLLVLSLLMVAGSAQANLLINGDFEDGPLGQTGMVGGVAIPGWYVWGYDDLATYGWVHDIAERVQVDQGITIGWNTTYILQEFAHGEIVEGQRYDFSIDVMDTTGVSGFPADDLSGWNGFLTAEIWDYDGAAWFIAEVSTVEYDYTTDPEDVWITLNTSLTAPAALSELMFGKIHFGLRYIDATYAGTLDFDNAVVTQVGAASEPWPEYISPKVPSDFDARGLEFTLPDDASITAIDYDVYWQVDDANDLNWTSIASTSGSSGERVLLTVPETITFGHTYHWKVVTDVTSADPDLTGIHEGLAWWFSVTNSPPIVDPNEPASQNIWLSSGSAVLSLSGSVTDDGFPDPPGAATTLWSSSPDTGVSFTDASSLVTDVTFTVAGDYSLTLTANDGDFDASDVVQVIVFDEGHDGLLALYEFEGNANDTAPVAGNHHGILDTTNTQDTTLPAIDSLDAKVGLGSLELTVDGQRVYMPDSGVADPNWAALTPTWADVQTTNQLTVSAWIKVNPGEFIYPWVSPLFKGEAYALSRNNDTSNGAFTVGSWSANDPGDMIVALDNDAISITLDDGNWHQIVGTYDGAFARYYVDGFLEAQTDNSEYFDAMPVGGGYLQIGSGLNGRIDQIRVHDVALSDAMIWDQFVADGGSNSCRQQYLSSDVTQDCYTDIEDFAAFAAEWLLCLDQTDVLCTVDIPLP